MKFSVIEPAAARPNGPPGAIQPLLVLKFGSSVLRGPDDLPAVAGEIYRQRRLGYRVIAVVSALGDETDRLLAEAGRIAGQVQCDGVADLVSLGEECTAALLRIACSRIGLRTEIIRAEQLQLVGAGPALDADFQAFHAGTLLRKLEASGVVIVPGFVAIGADGERLLLGRGGSDFTAAILGGELGADHVRLYKDVDGVFEADPAREPEARKFASVSYADALRLAGQLIHAKAVAFAAARQLPIVVEALGSNEPTWIGDCSRLEPPHAQGRLRVALAGYGVVGQALARRLAKDERFELVSILVRDPARLRDVPPPVPLTDDRDIFMATEADCLVELVSCARTAGLLAVGALARGRDVVTANKRLVGAKLRQLESLARRGGARLLHSASVGGGAPLLETIERVRQAAPIAEVRGVLNGTVNFVLGRLAEGEALEEALASARQLGFAEEDASADLSGADAAAKLRIIAAHAFDAAPAEVQIGIQPLDEALAERIAASGRRWVQLASVGQAGGAVIGSVAFLPLEDAGLPCGDGEWNVAAIRDETGAEMLVEGRGAGGPATAEAVLADLYELLHARTRAHARAGQDRPPGPVLKAIAHG